MKESGELKKPTQIELAEPRFREAIRLHEIEGCPLTPDDIAMFDMFHREGFSNESCLQYITDLVLDTVAKTSVPDAAE